MRKNNFLMAVAAVVLYQILLTACTVQAPVPVTGISAPTDKELRELYQRAKETEPPESERYRLQAAKLLLELDRLPEADTVFKSILSFTLSDEHKADYALTGARLAIALFDNESAVNLLGQHSNLIATRPVEVQIDAAKLRGQALLALEKNIESAKEYIFIAPFLSGEAAEQNKELIWSTLMKAQIEELRFNLQSTSFSDYQGWLEVVLLTRENLDDLDLQLQALDNWLLRWPQHPAALSLPYELAILKTMISERPERITLMLPLKGENATAGKAIRDGFLTAYYAARARQSNTPTIRIIDTTSHENFLFLYDNAVLEGTDLIIGPLEKEHVDILAAHQNLIVPTLALNYDITEPGPGREITENLFQFGLAAEDEARQVARRARQLGNKNSLVLAPETSWGMRIEQAFSDEWTKLEGTLLETQYFSDTSNYAQTASKLLHIDESEQRKQRMEQVLGKNLEFTARPREDMDFIFMIATPKQARQIKPTLAFYYVGSTPVYSTSHIYSGKEDPLLDRDLDGIIFCETPWMLGTSEKSLKTTIKRHWPANADRYGRLYAMGVDAYHLFPRTRQLALIPGSSINGETGSLTMNASRQVIRELHWAKIDRGIIKRIQ